MQVVLITGECLRTLAASALEIPCIPADQCRVDLKNDKPQITSRPRTQQSRSKAAFQKARIRLYRILGLPAKNKDGLITMDVVDLEEYEDVRMLLWVNLATAIILYLDLHLTITAHLPIWLGSILWVIALSGVVFYLVPIETTFGLIYSPCFPHPVSYAITIPFAIVASLQWLPDAGTYFIATRWIPAWAVYSLAALLATNLLSRDKTAANERDKQSREQEEYVLRTHQDAHGYKLKRLHNDTIKNALHDFYHENTCPQYRLVLGKAEKYRISLMNLGYPHMSGNRTGISIDNLIAAVPADQKDESVPPRLSVFARVSFSFGEAAYSYQRDSYGNDSGYLEDATKDGWEQAITVWDRKRFVRTNEGWLLEQLQFEGTSKNDLEMLFQQTIDDAKGSIGARRTISYGRSLR